MTQLVDFRGALTFCPVHRDTIEQVMEILDFTDEDKSRVRQRLASSSRFMTPAQGIEFRKFSQHPNTKIPKEVPLDHLEIHMHFHMDKKGAMILTPQKLEAVKLLYGSSESKENEENFHARCIIDLLFYPEYETLQMVYLNTIWIWNFLHELCDKIEPLGLFEDQLMERKEFPVQINEGFFMVRLNDTRSGSLITVDGYEAGNYMWEKTQEGWMGRYIAKLISSKGVDPKDPPTVSLQYTTSTTKSDVMFSFLEKLTELISKM